MITCINCLLFNRIWCGRSRCFSSSGWWGGQSFSRWGRRRMARRGNDLSHYRLYWIRSSLQNSAHFDRFHKPNIFIFTCPICKFKDARRSKITRHTKKHHKGQTVPHIPSKEVKTCKFIDPCNFKKPKKRIYHAEREKARLERINSIPKEPLFELSDNYNARDHGYPHGGYK